MRQREIMEDARYWLRREMTRDDALRVEKLRMTDELSWRGVASEFGLPDEYRGNQLAGMALCLAASVILGREIA